MSDSMVFSQRMVEEHMERLEAQRLRRKIEKVENPYPSMEATETSVSGVLRAHRHETFEEARQAILKALEV